MRAVALFLLCIAVPAFASPPDAGSAGLTGAYELADRNGDGGIDRREFQNRQSEVFYLSDRDKDGALSPSELGSVTPEALRAADANGDGKLQLKEFLNARAKDFGAADRDGDGMLSADEVAAFD